MARWRQREPPAGAVTGAVRSAEESGASGGPPGSRWHGNSGRRRRRQRLHLRGEFLPSSVHQITGTVSLYPRLGTVAMYSRLTSSPSLSDLRSSENTLRDDVAGHNVPGPDVFDKLVPAKHFPRMAGKKKTRRSIKTRFKGKLAPLPADLVYRGGYQPFTDANNRL